MRDLNDRFPESCARAETRVQFAQQASKSPPPPPNSLTRVGVMSGRALWRVPGRLTDEWLAFDDIYRQPYGARPVGSHRGVPRR